MPNSIRAKTPSPSSAHYFRCRVCRFSCRDCWSVVDVARQPARPDRATRTNRTEQRSNRDARRARRGHDPRTRFQRPVARTRLRARARTLFRDGFDASPGERRACRIVRLRCARRRQVAPAVSHARTRDRDTGITAGHRSRCTDGVCARRQCGSRRHEFAAVGVLAGRLDTRGMATRRQPAGHGLDVSRPERFEQRARACLLAYQDCARRKSIQIPGDCGRTARRTAHRACHAISDIADG